MLFYTYADDRKFGQYSQEERMMFFSQIMGLYNKQFFKLESLLCGLPFRICKKKWMIYFLKYNVIYNIEPKTDFSLFLV